MLIKTMAPTIRLPQHCHPFKVVSTRARLRCVGVILLLMTSASASSDVEDTNRNADAIAELTRPVSTIEIGGGNLSDNAYAAGNYTGLDRKGGFFIGNIDLRGSQYSYGNSEDDKTRWRIIGTDLGLSSRSIAGEYGRLGAYRITFGHDEIPRPGSATYQTPFLGAGSPRLTLPAGFVRGADTGAMSTLASSLQNFDIEGKRRRSEIGLSYALTREWELRGSWRNDESSGTKIRGGEFGSNGGNPRTVPLPEPIDSSTQRIEASLAFSGEAQRFTLSYHGSLFKNNIGSLTWQNPYSSAPWTGGVSGLPADFPLPNGQMSVAPDNQFHQFALSGAYDFSPSTRLTLAGTRGRMSQNEAFLPYAINPGLVTTALPRTSLNGVIETTFVNAKLSMRPLRNLAVTASLRHEERDNRTPMSEYIYVGGDIQLQPPAGSNSDRIRTNLPRSRRLQQIMLDADYRFSSSTAIRAGWDRDEVKRTFAEVEQTTENTYRIELRRGGTGPWTGNAGYALLVRRGTQYLYNLPTLASYTSPAYISALVAANGCTVLIDCVRRGPLQNKFYMADRDRERSRLAIGFMPDGALSLQTRLDVNRDRYPHSPYGLSDARSWSASADLGYVFNDDLSATLFYTLENQRSHERSRQIISANTAVASSADSDWINQWVDKTASIGFGMRYKGLIDGRLALHADALAMRGRTPISTTVGTAVPAAQNPSTPLPDLLAQSDNVNLGARYAVDRHSALRLNYFFQRLNSADWAYRQVGIATLTNALGTNEVSARYSVHGVGVSYVRSFR